MEEAQSFLVDAPPTISLDDDDAFAISNATEALFPQEEQHPDDDAVEKDNYDVMFFKVKNPPTDEKEDEELLLYPSSSSQSLVDSDPDGSSLFLSHIFSLLLHSGVRK